MPGVPGSPRAAAPAGRPFVPGRPREAASSGHPAGVDGYSGRGPERAWRERRSFGPPTLPTSPIPGRGPGAGGASDTSQPGDPVPGGPTNPAFTPGPRPGARPARPFDGSRPWPAARGAQRPSGAALVMADDEELVAGRRPVEEAFVAGRAARRLLVTPQRRDALERLVLHATALRIPIVEVEGGTLTATAGFDGHQGVALVVEARRFAAPDEILAHAIGHDAAPFVLALDSLEDPQNLGSLLRSAEAAGVDGVLFPTRRQAPLSPAAVKASAGATEHLLLAPVDDLAGALAGLHLRGLRIVGADADAALTYREADLRGPLVLVVGSEGRGLAPPIRRRCDVLVRIPMRGHIASLNAAVAGSILVFEAAMQRGAPEALPATPPDGVPAPDPAPGGTHVSARTDDAAPDVAAGVGAPIATADPDVDTAGGAAPLHPAATDGMPG